MGMRVSVLASGSSGNATLVETETTGVLIDVGLSPRQLSERLRLVGTAWSRVQAVVLTHTHSDHWKDAAFAQLLHRQIPLYCHPDHHRVPLQYGGAFTHLRDAGLVQSFEPGVAFAVSPSLWCTPLPVTHDSGPTFGFRFDATGDLFEPGPSVGYVADLGNWTEPLVAALRDVDLLAVEFNHDVEMEATSGRRPMLVARVLGDEGHLSNEQGAALVQAVIQRSARPMRHVVLLHLSRDCNRPALARAVAEEALAAIGCDAEVHVASQDRPGPVLDLALTERSRRPRGKAIRTRTASTWTQQMLPGLESGA